MPKLMQLTRQPVRAALTVASALLLAFALTFVALAQQKEAPASVSGRVTDGERGAFGVTVMLIFNEPGQRFRLAARAKTDADGRFLFTNIAPGRYQIMPVAPSYVVAGLGTNYPPGRPLTLNAGEEVKDIDFQMEAGGVITGRITDADGNPVIAEPVIPTPVEENMGGPRLTFDQRDQMTDDRGVYRIFGLPPGPYRVSVGRANSSGAVTFGRRKIFRRTFYPDATEQEQARIVEVKSGIESTDIDITVGRALKTYKVAGRFVTADTNQPVANIPVGFSTVDARGRRSGGYGSSATTNERGEFVTDGLAPGHYAVFASMPFGPAPEPTEFYSDPVYFEVTDSDVSGLLVKLKRGATVSGVVSIEGVPDRAAVAQMFSAVRIYPYLETPQQGGAMPARPVNVNPDGSFRVTGLSPGKLRLSTLNETLKNLTMTRVELNGANITGGYELTEGAQVTGVRIVLSYGSATIVGQTTYVNGTLPAGSRVMAFARLISQTPGTNFARSAEVDGRGYFRIEGMTAGEYEITVNVFIFSGGGGGARRSAPLRVVLGDGGEAKVAPVIDFNVVNRRRVP
ncbi:MAG: collagen binding domain-containing protein [Pyrinomonadaceae bacterium]